MLPREKCFNDVNLRLAHPIYLYCIKPPCSSRAWAEWVSLRARLWVEALREVWNVKSVGLWELSRRLQSKEQEKEKLFFWAWSDSGQNILLDWGFLSFFHPRVSDRWCQNTQILRGKKTIRILGQRPGIQTLVIWPLNLCIQPILLYYSPLKECNIVSWWWDYSYFKAINEWMNDVHGCLLW